MILKPDSDKPSRVYGILIISLVGMLLMGCASDRISISFRHTLKQHPESGVMIRDIQSVASITPYGAYAALGSVMNHWGVSVSPQTWSEDILWRHVNITPSMKDLAVIASQHDLWVFFSQSNWSQLKARLTCRVPVIVLVMSEYEKGTSRRFLVIAGYDDIAETLLVLNGREPVEQWSYEAFFKAWNRCYQWMMTICPPDQACWDMSVDEMIDRAAWYEQRALYEDAFMSYQAILDGGTRDARALVGCGNCYFATNDYPNAEMCYRQAIQLDALNGHAYNNLAYVLAVTSNKLSEAAWYVDQALALDPANPRVLETAGYTFYRMGQLDKAAGYLEKARAKASDAPLETRIAILDRLIQVYYTQDYKHLLKQVLTDAQKMDPEYVPDEEIVKYLNTTK